MSFTCNTIVLYNWLKPSYEVWQGNWDNAQKMLNLMDKQDKELSKLYRQITDAKHRDNPSQVQRMHEASLEDRLIEYVTPEVDTLSYIVLYCGLILSYIALLYCRRTISIHR